MAYLSGRKTLAPTPTQNVAGTTANQLGFGALRSSNQRSAIAQPKAANANRTYVKTKGAGAMPACQLIAQHDSSTTVAMIITVSQLRSSADTQCITLSSSSCWPRLQTLATNKTA